MGIGRVVKCDFRGIEGWGWGEEERVLVGSFAGVVDVGMFSLFEVLFGLVEAAAEHSEEEDEEEGGKRRASTLSRNTSSHHELRWPLLKLPRPSITQRSILPFPLFSKVVKAGITSSRKNL